MALDYEPRLLKSDFDEYKMKGADLVRKCQAGEFSDGMLNIQLQWLSEWFGERMAPEDKRVFPNTIRLREFLVQRMSFEQAQEFIEHEMEHAEMAEALGYQVGYGVYLMKDEQGGLGYVPFCSFKGNITPEHWKLIHQSPSELSDYQKDEAPPRFKRRGLKRRSSFGCSRNDPSLKAGVLVKFLDMINSLYPT